MHMVVLVGSHDLPPRMVGDAAGGWQCGDIGVCGQRDDGNPYVAVVVPGQSMYCGPCTFTFALPLGRS